MTINSEHLKGIIDRLQTMVLSAEAHGFRGIAEDYLKAIELCQRPDYEEPSTAVYLNMAIAYVQDLNAHADITPTSQHYHLMLTLFNALYPRYKKTRLPQDDSYDAGDVELILKRIITASESWVSNPAARQLRKIAQDGLQLLGVKVKVEKVGVLVQGRGRSPVGGFAEVIVDGVAYTPQQIKNALEAHP